MSFLSDLFGHKTRGESVVLIDIGADSIAGAYARYETGQKPLILYTRRMKVEPRNDELPVHAMLRALKTLGNALVSEGAPVLAHATGSGTADIIVVSIDAPWQKTSIRTEYIEKKDPFSFTKAVASEMLEKGAPADEGKILVDESIIGTMLNGYVTSSPYGKKAERADIVILTSLIDEHVAHNIIKTLRSVYHTTRILPIAGTSLRCQAVQAAFPHESDVLVLDASGDRTSIALLRKGLFTYIAEVQSANSIATWPSHVGAALAELARLYPLPRTILLLARESDAQDLQKTFNEAKLSSLWLSDVPPTIVTVLASHMLEHVRQSAAAEADLQLLLEALYYLDRGDTGER